MTQPGTQRGRNVLGFIIKETLGEGAFGKVRLGVDSVRKVRAAIKCVLKALVKCDIRKEISICKMLKHRNIIQLIEVTENSDMYYLILEYASGGELFDRIEPDIGIADAWTHHYFRQLMLAMSFIHEKGVSHRDIKPENLLLDHFGNLKVTDFGLATLFRYKKEVRLLDRRCGTPPYIAPEVLSGKPYHAPPVDVWSAGIVLVTMLAGCMPWDEPTVRCSEFIAFHSGDLTKIPWPQIKEVPTALLKNILTIRPSHRATIDDILVHAWVKRTTSLTPFVDENGMLAEPEEVIKARLTQASGIGANSASGSIPNVGDSEPSHFHFSQPSQRIGGASQYLGTENLKQTPSRKAPNPILENSAATAGSSPEFRSPPQPMIQRAVSRRRLNSGSHDEGLTDTKSRYQEIMSASQPIITGVGINESTTQCADDDSQFYVGAPEFFSQPTHNFSDETAANLVTAAFPDMVRRMTRFTAVCEPHELLSRIQQVLDELSISWRSVRPDTMVMETIDKSRQSVQFSVRLYPLLKYKSLMADFRRIKGNGLYFKRIFLQIRDALMCHFDMCNQTQTSS